VTGAMRAPRVAVIGARRRRNGLGPFAVGHLLRAGARVPCFLATGEATREAARRDLARRFGAAPRGYLDLDAMLGSEELDALAILSPAETHESFLEAAAAVGLHVLCEKPLVWGMGDPAQAAARIADRFEALSLALWENCPWPYALPAFARLHPARAGGRGAPPREVRMQLQPASRGVQALGDMLPHVVSLLQALVPGRAPAAEAIGFSTRDPEAERLEARFTYRTGEASTRAVLSLERSDVRPRRAALAVDGLSAERVVTGPDFALSLFGEGRSVPLPDPFAALVADFVRQLPAKPGLPAVSRGAEIRERMAVVSRIARAFAEPVP